MLVVNVRPAPTALWVLVRLTTMERVWLPVAFTVT
jgi:hypothetical protein